MQCLSANKTRHTQSCSFKNKQTMSQQSYLQLSKESTAILEQFYNTAFRRLLNNSQAYYLSNNLFNILFKQNFLGTFCFHQCLALFMNFLIPKSTSEFKTIYHIRFLSVGYWHEGSGALQGKKVKGSLSVWHSTHAVKNVFIPLMAVWTPPGSIHG